jgi:hypothetical protein
LLAPPAFMMERSIGQARPVASTSLADRLLHLHPISACGSVT